MKPSSLVAYLRSKGTEVAPFDPNRAKRIYSQLERYLHIPKHIIHLVGTNGKGSTGRFITLALIQNHRSVLHFSSPHLFEFHERFYLNGQHVSDEALERAHNFLQTFGFIKESSYFEYATFLALVLAQDCEFLVLEAGVGGEFDSTSVVKCELSFFTPIGIDHRDFLGDSIESIAGTKLRAMKENAILSKQEFLVTQQLAYKIAKEYNARIFSMQNIETCDDFMHACEAFAGVFGAKTKLQDYKCVFNLFQSYCLKNHYVGFLKQNLLGAFFVLRFYGLDIDFTRLKALDLRGRAERIAENILVDVGHNLECAKALVAVLLETFAQKRFTLVYNSYFDKDINGILEFFKPYIERVLILPIFENERIVPIHNLKAILKRLEIDFVEFDSLSLEKDKYYLVFGSFSVVEEFLKCTASKR